MSEPIIELRNVGVAFNAQLRMGAPQFWALEDVNLVLPRGARSEGSYKTLVKSVAPRAQAAGVAVGVAHQRPRASVGHERRRHRNVSG